MALTIVTGLLPLNWRKTLATRVDVLPTENLGYALGEADDILAKRSEADIEKAAKGLVQSIAKMQGSIVKIITQEFAATVLNPRKIFNLYSSDLISKPPRGISLLESMAIGTVYALGRACDAIAVAKNKSSWLHASKELAMASAFSEWMYMALIKGNGASTLMAVPSKQELRQAVKAKIKAQKSAAAKKGARKASKQDKLALYEWYEKHKSQFTSTAKAVDAAVATDLFHFAHSTLSTWLYAYVKTQKAKN